MSRVITACLPASDIGFRERIRDVLSEDRWDLNSPEGLALMQTVLRGTYPMATVLSHGVAAGGRSRTTVLEIYRDGPPGAAATALRWAEEVYDRSGASAYRLAVRILGEGSAAEWVVEQAFRDLRRSAPDKLSVEAGVAAIEAAALLLADQALAAEHAAPVAAATTGPEAGSVLAGISWRKGPVRRVLSPDALDTLLSSQRAALELSVLEDLKVHDIAERMQTTPKAIHGHLNKALVAVGSGERPTAAATLARWRESQRSWAELPPHDRARPEQGVEAAHAWLDYQVASNALPPSTVVLITDADRHFVATSSNAAQTLGRPSVVGLRIDDVTAPYARPLVPELWTMFDANGSMSGEYDCDRPGQVPVRTQFHGVWGRPLPNLQVGYLKPPVAVPPETMAAL